jgi:NAD(P)H-dependent flavin oxidoreductase YrpB (nitropropane dioxygenase family)
MRRADSDSLSLLEDAMESTSSMKTIDGFSARAISNKFLTNLQSASHKSAIRILGVFSSSFLVLINQIESTKRTFQIRPAIWTQGLTMTRKRMWNPLRLQLLLQGKIFQFRVAANQKYKQTNKQTNKQKQTKRIKD